MEPEELLALVVQAFEAVGVPYMLTGSLASIYYGEPRLTNDIDLVADLRPEHLPTLAERFPQDDFLFDEVSAAEAVRMHRPFNILHPGSGLKIDVMVCRGRDFSRLELQRRERVELLPGLTASIARPEDVILVKLEFYAEGASDKHLRDIAGILAVSGEQLDQAYLAEWAQRLGLAEIWRELGERAG